MKTDKDIEQLFTRVNTPELNPDLKDKVLGGAQLIQRTAKREAVVFRAFKWVIAAMILLTLLFNSLSAVKNREIRVLAGVDTKAIINTDTEIREEFGLPTQIAQRAAERNAEMKQEERLRMFLRK